MPFHSQNINPLSDLVDLKSVVKEDPNNPEQHSLEVELGIFESEVVVDQATIAVSLRQATLALDLEGLEVVERSKYGIDHVPSKLTSKAAAETVLQTTVETSRAAEAIVSGELTAIMQSAKASASRRVNESNTATASMKETRETQVDHYPVKAVGGDKWRITDVDGGALDRTFLNYDRLCGLKPKSGRPNRQATTLTVYARQRDMDASILKDGRFMSRVGANKERVIGILVAKGLHEAASAVEYEGVVTLSASKAEHEE